MRNRNRLFDARSRGTSRPRWIGRLLWTTLLAASLLTLLAADSAAQIRQDTDAQYTADGTEHCLRCHGSERMHVMADTAHGNIDNPFTPYAKQGCEACHGPGSLHVSRARGGIGFPQMLSFADEPASRKSAACLGCHGKDMGALKGMQWVGSVHDTGGISCGDCHEMHAVGNPLVERAAQVDVCGGCHSEQIANHRRFEDKGIVFEELNCSNCHDVHQMIREP